jgi:hypothetical protein
MGEGTTGTCRTEREIGLVEDFRGREFRRRRQRILERRLAMAQCRPRA